MGKAADWLREERRNVLGHWVAVCLGCGAARRWFEEFEADVPATCAQCGGEGTTELYLDPVAPGAGC